MQIKLFNIPLMDDGSCLAEMNKFMAGNKVLEVEQQFFQNEKGACWSFCVRYIANALPNNSFGISKTKKDYKSILNDSHFANFSRLREIRKEIAANDAVPAYAVFTDEELATVAQLPEITLEDMQKIKGFGEKKIQKYGKQLLEILNAKKAIHEAGN